MVDVADAGLIPQSPSSREHSEYMIVPAILGRDNYTNGFHYTNVEVRNRAGNAVQEPLDETSEESQSSAKDKNTFFCERERLETFGNWSHSYPVKPQDLARNGFIYRGFRDEVMCVFCSAVISDWAAGADVECTHRFLECDCPIYRRESNNKPITITRPSINEILLSLNPAVSAFVDEAVRLDSFQYWPSTNKKDPKSLAEAGFFYKPQGGKPDRVKCFMCGKIIHKWEPQDDPWREHGRISRSCKFVRYIKGQEFLDQCATKQTLKPMTQKTKGNEPTQPQSPSPPSDSQLSGEDLSKSTAVQAVLQSSGKRFCEEQVVEAFKKLSLKTGGAVMAKQLLEKLTEDEG